MNTGLKDDQFSKIRESLTKDAYHILYAVTSEKGHLGDIISCLKTSISSIELKVESLSETFKDQKTKQH